MKEESDMGEKATIVKGRIKEAAGVLTDNDKLRREGKADQAAGKVKGVVRKAANAITSTVEKVENAVNDALEKGNP